MTYTCEKCGRTITTSPVPVVGGLDEFQWWLAGPNPSGTKVTFCPQHITVWALRRAGYGRGKNSMIFMEQAKANDPRKDVVPFSEPYPM